jgi:peptidyl-prolyl cis-trans isomerase B (cyclophilin B)
LEQSKEKEFYTMALYTPQYQPNGKEIAVIKTSKGTIRVQLAGNDAPIHVGNFIELAQKGFYDNLKFHRLVDGFVVQGGCPNTRDLSSEEVQQKAGSPYGGLGSGNPGYSIKEEYSTNPNNKHLNGTLAMARSQDPNSAGSQFYLCLGDQPMLDSGYTVFGQTIDGLDVMESLSVGDVIENIEIENANV